MKRLEQRRVRRVVDILIVAGLLVAAVLLPIFNGIEAAVAFMLAGLALTIGCLTGLMPRLASTLVGIVALSVGIGLSAHYFTNAAIGAWGFPLVAGYSIGYHAHVFIQRKRDSAIT